MSRKGLPGFSFSLSRALGISAAKQRASKQLGIPLTKGARQRKLGAGLGCAVVLAQLVAGGWLLGEISFQKTPAIREVGHMTDGKDTKQDGITDRRLPALFATIHHRSDQRPHGYTADQIAALNKIANESHSK